MNRLGSATSPYLLRHKDNPVDWWEWGDEAFSEARRRDVPVLIKVDREERPDVDAVYMTATQAMTGQGGWPMTVFATPDGTPFFCGTYYPREQFMQLLGAVGDAWRDQREAVLKQGSAVV